MEISEIKNEEQYQEYLERLKNIILAKEGMPEYNQISPLASVIETYKNENFSIIKFKIPHRKKKFLKSKI